MWKAGDNLVGVFRQLWHCTRGNRLCRGPARGTVVAGALGTERQPPNEMRVSCGAMLACSQTDGLHRKRRRQLHARVRQRARFSRLGWLRTMPSESLLRKRPGISRRYPKMIGDVRMEPCRKLVRAGAPLEMRENRAHQALVFILRRTHLQQPDRIPLIDEIPQTPGQLSQTSMTAPWSHRACLTKCA